jgi:hypothetical protein
MCRMAVQIVARHPGCQRRVEVGGLAKNAQTGRIGPILAEPAISPTSRRRLNPTGTPIWREVESYKLQQQERRWALTDEWSLRIRP